MKQKLIEKLAKEMCGDRYWSAPVNEIEKATIAVNMFWPLVEASYKASAEWHSKTHKCDCQLCKEIKTLESD